MSRRDVGARQVARHARDRLQSTLGDGAGLLTDGEGQVFEYDGGAHHGRAAVAPEADAAGPPGAGAAGPALRWRVGLPVALLIAALALLGGGWFWSQVAAGEPDVVPLSDVSSQGSGSAGNGAAPGQDAGGTGPQGAPEDSPPAGMVIVHIAGAVAVPGVVQLPAGSRVHQAVVAAGGGIDSADLDRLNLAAVLADGQKLYVPVHGEVLPPDASGDAGTGTEESGGGASPRAGKINLNTASVEELDALPKVGPVLAQRIVDWRKQHGLFRSVEELDAIDGVGPKMLETLLPLLGI